MSKVQIKDVFDLQIGKTPSRKKQSFWSNGTIDWVSIRDLGSFDRYVGSTKERITQLAVDESGIKPVPPNTLIMSFKLSLGKTAITVGPTYTNEAIMAFVDKRKYPIDLNYLFHQFSSKDWSAGTNMAVMGATLNKKTLSESWIEVPDIEEQHRVAGLLDMVYERIADVHGLLSSLDRLAKSRFEELFIGKGYQEVQLGDYCEHVNNGMMRRGNDSGGSIVLRLVELQEGYIDYSSVNRIALTDKEKAKYLLHDGDLLLARVNGNPDNVGRSAFFSDIGEPVFHNDHVIRATVKRDIFDPTFLVFFLNSGFGRPQIEKGLKTSAGQYTINQESVRAICLPMPPLAIQQEFAASVRQIDNLKKDARLAIDKLQLLYDSLAQECFGG